MSFVKGAMYKYQRSIIYLLSFLILTELFIRAAFLFTHRDIRAYYPTSQLLYRKDPFLGYALRPNLNFDHKNIRLRINSLGFRGGEFNPYETRPFRVFVLGGSDVFNILQDYNRPFCEILQDKLNERYPDRNTEIINAGVPGYTTFQSFINFSMRILDYNPDGLIIYHVWNDIKYWPYVDRTINYSQLSQLRGASIDRTLLGRLSDRYYTYIVLKTLIRITKNKIFKENQEVIESTYSYDKKIYDTSYGELIYRRNIEGIIQIAKKNRVKVLLLNPLTLIKDTNSKEEINCINYHLVHVSPTELPKLVKRAGDILEDIAKTEQIPYINLNDQIPQDLDNLNDHIHLTKKGNEAIAELLAGKWDEIWNY